jgi:hypothetical protein
MASREYGSCADSLRADDVEWREEGEILSRILCRLRELKQIGCDEPDCIVLAGRLDVDLDEAVELIRRGCPPGLAVRILV